MALRDWLPDDAGVRAIRAIGAGVNPAGEKERKAMAVESTPRQSGTAPDQVVDAFVAAWNTSDETARWRLLEQCWTDDGILFNRSIEVKSCAELASTIKSILASWPTGSHVQISPVQEHHGWLCYSFKIFRSDGSTYAEGIHVAERDQDGRIRKLINFSLPNSVGGN